MGERTASAQDGGDIAALAKGGRTNFLGFLLRLLARLPFLFIAGRVYGADALGRFAYAVLVIEFAAQLATLGLKRGLAQQLSRTDQPHVNVVADALLVGAIASAVAASVLIVFPEAMFPNSQINGLERLMPLIVFAIAGSDIALAALAYRLDIESTVRARAIVEPWTISLGAFAFSYYSLRDGLILSYALSMVAALAASLWPLVRSYGLPTGWKPKPATLFWLARENVPLAAADAIDWASRRIDIAILGLFVSPALVGIYYVAQQVASLPQKLKTSFDPILGPVITRNLKAGDKAAVAKQVAQAGFWIIAAQAGVALALGIPGEAVMGLVGPNFVDGTGALAFLLAAEVVAATAAVSESALVYTARHRNLMISMGMIGLQVALTFAFIFIFDALTPRVHIRNDTVAAAGAAAALMVALGIASFVKAWLLTRILGAPVFVWRPAIIWAAAAATVVGFVAVQVPEWLELIVGMPMILLTYGYIIWTRGFGPEDRALFRKAAVPVEP